MFTSSFLDRRHLQSSTEQSRQPRKASIELLRFLASIGIVFFHCNAAGAAIGHAGLPAFIALSTALASAPANSPPFAKVVYSKALRLLLPWSFWCCVYLVLRLFAAYVKGVPLSHTLKPWMILTGPSIHLWYLPFAFVVTCLVSTCHFPTSLSGIQRTLLATFIAVTVFTLSSWWLSAGAQPYPLAQWAFGLPAVFFGLGLPRNSDRDTRWPQVIIVVFATSLVCLAMALLECPVLSVPYFVGICALSIAWMIDATADDRITWLGGVSFGIYLIHPLIVSIVEFAAGIKDGSGLALIVSAVAVIAVALLRRGSLRIVL